jgi:hypothetical protein
MLIKKVPKWDLISFNDAIENNLGFRYPIYYLTASHCYGIKRSGRYVAGFILHDDYRTMRVLCQISPIDRTEVMRKLIFSGHANRLTEYTGYFIEDKKIGFIFTLIMILIAIKKGSNFLYSFDRSNIKLADYYAPGSPFIVYRGQVKYDIEKPNGQTQYTTGFEQIEVITQVGIIKIFVSRTIRELLKWIRRVF